MLTARESRVYTDRCEGWALGEAVALHVQRKRDAAIQLELLVDVMQMQFRGALGNRQFSRNSFGVQAVGNHARDLQLARSKPLGDGIYALFAFEKILDSTCRDTLIKPFFAGVHFANAVYEHLRRRVLQHDPPSAEPDCLEDFIAVHSRQDDDTCAKLGALHFAQHAQSIHARHTEIENKNIRLKLPHGLQRFISVLGVRNDRKIRFFGENEIQPTEDDGVIVRQDQTNRHDRKR